MARSPSGTLVKLERYRKERNEYFSGVNNNITKFCIFIFIESKYLHNVSTIVKLVKLQSIIIINEFNIDDEKIFITGISINYVD